MLLAERVEVLDLVLEDSHLKWQTNPLFQDNWFLCIAHLWCIYNFAEGGGGTKTWDSFRVDLATSFSPSSHSQIWMVSV